MHALDDEVRAGKVLYVGISDIPARANTPRLDPVHRPAAALQPGPARDRA